MTSSPEGCFDDVRPLGGAGVRIGLDAARHRFLEDHRVNGRPLLSTVMGMEAMASAMTLIQPGAAVRGLTDVRVGPPFLLPAAGVGSVRVDVAGLHCSLVSDPAGEHVGGQPAVHFTADVELGTPADREPLVAPGTTGAVVAGAQVPGTLVYGLYFHGASFQVVAEAGRDGRTLTSRLARGLPPVCSPPRPSLTAPLLVELCLQSAGLWELAETGAMTVPSSIDAVRRLGPLDSDTSRGLVAVVTATEETGGRHRFDACVVDDHGTVQVVVEGYRTTPFGGPVDAAAAARLRGALTAAREPRLSPAVR